MIPQMSGVSLLMKLNDGEVWLVKYRFEEDLTVFKIRPVVVINNQAVSIHGYKMTSQPMRSSKEYLIKDLHKAGLPKKTVIRTSKFIPLDAKILVRKLGELSMADLAGFKALLHKQQK